MPAALCIEPEGSGVGITCLLNLSSHLGCKTPFVKDSSSSLAGMLQEEIPSPWGFWTGACAVQKERDQLGRQTDKQVQSLSLLHFNLKLKLPLEHSSSVEGLKWAQAFKSIPFKEHLPLKEGRTFELWLIPSTYLNHSKTSDCEVLSEECYFYLNWV